jgi:hypothetical protein
VQECGERPRGKVVKVGRRVNQAPAFAAQTRIEAADITSRDGQGSAVAHHRCEAGDDLIRLPQVLDYIPHAHDVKRAVDGGCKKIARRGIDAQNIPGVRNGGFRDVHTLNGRKVGLGQLQEKTVRAANFEQVLTCGLGDEARDRLQPLLEAPP